MPTAVTEEVCEDEQQAVLVMWWHTVRQYRCLQRLGKQVTHGLGCGDFQAGCRKCRASPDYDDLAGERDEIRNG